MILFRIAAWDTNCPQHIPQKFDAADVAAALAARDARIAELEAELASLKGKAIGSRADRAKPAAMETPIIERYEASPCQACGACCSYSAIGRASPPRTMRRSI